MLHLGDLCHGPTHVMDFVEEYNNFHIPSYHCIGNHDVQTSTRDEGVAAYRMPDHHYVLDKGGYRFIIADTNYLYDAENDEYVPYDKTNYYGVVTLEGTPITVEGCEPTTMYCGVGLKDFGMPEYDSMGRKYTTYVSSSKITLG